MSLASRKLIQATADAADTGDDDFANVVLLLDGDGTNGDANNTFTDSSTNGFTVTETGSVIQGSFSPYGDNWSNYFDGVSTDYLSVSDSTAFDFGTGDFTVECWFYETGQVGSFTMLGACEGVNQYFGYGTLGSGGMSMYAGPSSDIYSGLSSTPASNQWNHLVWQRRSGRAQMYLNGTRVYDAVYSADFGSTASGFQVGRSDFYASYYAKGYISNFRVITGQGYYDGASITVPAAPLEAVTNTELLTCSSNGFADESTNNNTIAISGTPKVTPFSPFKDNDARDITTDGGSGYFDGTVTNNKLTISDATALSPEGQDFTLEAWVYTNGVVGGDSQGIWIKWTAGNQEIFFSLDPNLKVFGALYIGGNINLTSTNAIKPYSWNHVALTRSGTTATVWINGNSEATATASGTIINDTDTVYIGGYALGNYELNGYISDLRWVKGTAVYTSAFTPPTSPLTAITNTETLLSFQDAGIYDRSGINNLDTVGNAQIDTAVVKYGTGSLEFDETGDYLTLPLKDEIALGTGDFTIEGWLYIGTNPVGNGQGMFQISNGYLNSAVRGPAAGVNNGDGKWSIYYGTSQVVATAVAAPSINTWYHVAYVRNSSTTKLYIDGTELISVSDSTDYTDTYLTIGGWYSTSYLLNGFIDDFRITKGIARYTSAFTPPDAELPKF